MGLTRAVTTFAAGFFRGLFSRSQAFEVWILVKTKPNVGMACLTDYAADKCIVIRGSVRGMNNAEG
jgi:hypothetical protein